MLEQWQSVCEQMAAEETVVESAGTQLASSLGVGSTAAANLLLQHPLGGLVGSTAATMVGAAAHHHHHHPGGVGVGAELNGLGALSRAAAAGPGAGATAGGVLAPAGGSQVRRNKSGPTRVSGLCT